MDDEEQLSGAKKLEEADPRSKTHQKIPNGILELRKQMLLQEYKIIEEQNQELQNLDLSPETKDKYMRAGYETPNEIAQEGGMEDLPRDFELNENFSPK